MEPIETRVISNDEEVELYKGEFIIETIIPYAVNPELRRYRMTREQLEGFFDFYGEHAEYVVSVSREKQA